MDQEHHDHHRPRERHTIPTLLKLARDGRIEAEKLGTHHFALGEIEEAYDVFGAAGSTTR